MSFKDLTYDEQVSVLCDFCRLELLPRWFGAAACEVECIRHFQNSTFRVVVTDGSRAGFYALRVNRVGAQTIDTVRSELAWLAALNRETDLRVPRPLAPQDDSALYVTARIGNSEDESHEIAEGERIATLFQWIPGEMRDDDLTPAHIEQVGQVMGKLHRHSTTWQPPAYFTRCQLEWGQPHNQPPRRIPETGSGQMAKHYHNIETGNTAVVTPSMWQTFAEVRATAEPIMRGLGRSPAVYGLIHNDIYQKNMLWQDDDVWVLDFDNCGYGHYLLDMAVLLAKLLPHADYPAKRAALLRGYRSQRDLPDDHAARLDAFIAARIMLLALYLAGQMHHPGMRDYIPGFVQQSERDLRRWLTTGSFI